MAGMLQQPKAAQPVQANALAVQASNPALQGFLQGLGASQPTPQQQLPTMLQALGQRYTNQKGSK